MRRRRGSTELNNVSGMGDDLPRSAGLADDVTEAPSCDMLLPDNPDIFLPHVDGNLYGDSLPPSLALPKSFGEVKKGCCLCPIGLSILRNLYRCLRAR